MACVDHIGEECPECGIQHRLIESLPKRPLRVSEVRSFEESLGARVGYPILPVSGELFGLETEADATKDVVMATEDLVRVVGYYADVGWVVDEEVAVDTRESPEEVAFGMYKDVSMEFVEVLEYLLADQEAEGPSGVRDKTVLRRLLMNWADGEPDQSRQFAPDSESDREMKCCYCGETFLESAVRYEERFGVCLWWCPTEGCEGAGVGFDIQPLTLS